MQAFSSIAPLLIYLACFLSSFNPPLATLLLPVCIPAVIFFVYEIQLYLTLTQAHGKATRCW